MEEMADSGKAAGRRHDELMKQERSKLDRLEELTKQRQNGSLDSRATADIVEALEGLKADYRVRLDVHECEKGVFELPELFEP